MKQVNLKNLCMILLGNTVYALAIVMFILPNDMITGGTTHQQRRDCIRYLTGTDLYRHSGQGTADGIYQNKSRDHD